MLVIKVVIKLLPSLSNYILEKKKRANGSVVFKGTFNTGPQGDFCTHEICDDLRQNNIRFHAEPKKSNAPPPTFQDIVDYLADSIRESICAKQFPLARDLTSVGEHNNEPYQKCARVCRYDLSRGDKSACTGLTIDSERDQDDFLAAGGVLFKPNALRWLRAEETESGHFCFPINLLNIYHLAKMQALGIKTEPFIQNGHKDRFTFMNEASLCASVLSGAKITGSFPIFQKHDCATNRLG